MSWPRLKWRRAFILGGIFVVLAGLTILATPLWFPWVARPVARVLGFEFAACQRSSLTTFEMRGVEGRFDTVSISVGRLEAFLPHRWLWELWTDGGGAPAYASIADWKVEVQPHREAVTSRHAVESTHEVLNRADRIARSLKTWLPVARFRNGVVQVGGVSAEVTDADWGQSRLRIAARLENRPEPVRILVDATVGGRLGLRGEGLAPGLGLELQLARDIDAWSVDGAIQLAANRLEGKARFAEDNWLPTEAEINGIGLSFDTEELSLSHYPELHGDFAFRWAKDRFTLEVGGGADPYPAVSGVWPPIKLNLVGRGTPQSAAIEELEVDASWLSVRLKDPISMAFSGEWLTESALCEAQLDLSGLRLPQWDGMLTAELRVVPGTNQYPTVSFEASGSGLHAGEIEMRQLEAKGALRWPVLELETALMDFGSNSVARIGGRFDLSRKELEAGLLETEGEYLRRFMPENLGWEGLKMRVSAEGPLETVRHAGEVQVDRMLLPGIEPPAVTAHWEGESLKLTAFDVAVVAGESTFEATGHGEGEGWPPRQITAALEQLNLNRAGQNLYRLNGPFGLRWRRAESVPVGWELEIDPWVWQGENRLLSGAGRLRWPHGGQGRLQAERVSSADVRDFWPGPGVEVDIPSLELVAGWTNGPVAWRLEGVSRLRHAEQATYEIGLRARGDATGTLVERLAVTREGTPGLVGQGMLPLLLRWPGDALVELNPEGTIDFLVTNQVADFVNVPFLQGDRAELTRPQFELRLGGTVDAPEGQIQIALENGRWQSGSMAMTLPAVEDLLLEASLRPARVELKRLEFELEGEPVVARGELPLGTNAWRDVVMGTGLPDWRKASGRVQIEGADLAPIAERLPKLLTSQGYLQLDLRVEPGLQLGGQLVVTNAATRPLGMLAPIRDIDGMVRFLGRTARVDRFSARLGGRDVLVSGQATLTETGQAEYLLRLRGTNAPLLREPGLLLRSDLELQLQKLQGQQPSITGEVRLRDGLLLQDIGSLLVNRLERPSLRPPYFSVTNLPFARWQVDVRVSGDQFLRVRSPVFAGVVSVDGRVQGILEKPTVNADVRIPKGRILFPFGKLEVEQAYATLTGDEPRGPMLNLVAGGLNYNYNIRLEVTGPVDKPNVFLSSTPPLTSEEILMMLTAGELPQREITYSSEARAGRLIGYLGKEVVTRFFGNEMGEERLIINSGENIARSGRTTYSVEYRLTERWSLVGEYDQFNALNAGLKWRIYSR